MEDAYIHGQSFRVDMEEAADEVTKVLHWVESNENMIAMPDSNDMNAILFSLARGLDQGEIVRGLATIYIIGFRKGVLNERARRLVDGEL